MKKIILFYVKKHNFKIRLVCIKILPFQKFFFRSITMPFPGKQPEKGIVLDCALLRILLLGKRQHFFERLEDTAVFLIHTIVA